MRQRRALGGSISGKPVSVAAQGWAVVIKRWRVFILLRNCRRFGCWFAVAVAFGGSECDAHYYLTVMPARA
jgi:hypothetical protein